jgi:aspartate racemase
VKGLGPLIGVLGGMGPLATADFMKQLARLTLASCDQDHFRSLVVSNPRLPDRSQAILGCGPSPLPGLLDGVALLERNGVDVIVIPCNSAHYWLGELEAATRIPILSIFEAVRLDLARLQIRGAVGVLGTPGTIKSGIYQRHLAAAGFATVEPDDETLATYVEPAIRAVKSGQIEAATRLAYRAIEQLEVLGAAAIVLGCTELPIAVNRARTETGAPVIDSTTALAGACIDWASTRAASHFMPQTAGAEAVAME